MNQKTCTKDTHSTVACAQQIRGKDDNVVTDEELSQLDLIYDVVLSPGDVLYIPRGYLHQVTLHDSSDDLYATADDQYSIHLSMGLEVDTLGFTMESFMFCAMGLSLQTGKGEEEHTQRELEQKMQDYSRLTWLSGYLWQWTFMAEETRKIFPFFESEYLLKLAQQDDDADLSELQQFQKELYEDTLGLIDKFEVALQYTRGVDEEKLRENKVPTVRMEHVKNAHKIFHDGMARLRALFRAKLSLQKDAEFADVVDRNVKFDELMVAEIGNVYRECGVPVDIVGDGEQEFRFDSK